MISNPCQLLLISVVLSDARASYGFVCLSVCVFIEFKISCKVLNVLFLGVSEFVLIGKDALQSEVLSSVTIP